MWLARCPIPCPSTACGPWLFGVCGCSGVLRSVPRPGMTGDASEELPLQSCAEVGATWLPVLCVAAPGLGA